jgi:two-component system cell cycle sensor histidine kinase/response regulator CckA
MLGALKAESQIRAACIYRNNGTRLATYTSDNAKPSFPATPANLGFGSKPDRLTYFAQIYDEREDLRIGTIYLEADIGGVRQRVQSYAGLLALVVLTSGLIALALSARLQQYISAPILGLANASKVVSARRDYSMRVAQDGHDEIGELIASFNEMLTQIQSRDAALQQAHDGLELRVAERTGELQREVTERTRAEAELAHSLSLVRATLESTADGILVVDADDKVVSFNRKFVHMWDIPDELIARQDDRCLREFLGRQVKNPEAFLAKIAELYANPEAESYDSIAFKDGRLFERYSQPQRVNGVCAGRVWSFRDISERTRAEERIREQASLLDLAQDAIIVRDMHHVILYWNKGAERIFGWKRDEVVGRELGKSFYRDVAGFSEANEAVLERDEWAGELTQLTKDRQEVITESRWTLLRDSTDQPKSVLIINTDITERKKLEAQFLRAQRMESIGTLAGGIAHDLNNVLAPILMSVELLRSRVKDRTLDRILEAVESSAQRGADLVRQILYFARGVEGKRVLFQPDRLLSEVFKIARDTFPKNIEISCSIASDLWPVSGHPTQLHQIVLNLCVNARDAMPDGGHLRITAENFVSDGSPEALKTAPAAGPHVVLRVSDTGTGIPEELRDRIFEPFFTTKEVGKGTGLGLSTAIGIVKGHSGLLDFVSEKDKGTTFTICLPALPAAAQGEKPEEAMRPAGGHELVLVVDDEASVRLVMQQTLEDFGYRVITAPDGASAIATYGERGSEISVVVTDMMMPGMDGSATIRGLKKINPGARIVAATGIVTEERLGNAADAGAIAFLRKPYTAEVLLRTLQQVLVGAAA